MQKGLNKECLNILPVSLASIIEKMDGVTELRLRVGKRLGVQILGVDKLCSYIVTRNDLDTVIAKASGRSIYACQDSLSHGYLPCLGGVRIGVCGEGVSENGRVVTVKNIQSIVVRLPHAIIGCADSIQGIMRNFDNTLIISEPSAGKTTLLREMVRTMSNSGKNVLLLDERGEVSAMSEGNIYLDVGECCDVVAYMPKAAAYESAVRSMNPSVIATDEIFGESEINAIIDVVRSGVKVLATVHGDSIDKVLSLPPYNKLKGVFRYGILLSKSPKVGSIREVREL